MNFGQDGNGQICECGKHVGVGSWSPEDRAAAYAFMRDKISSYYNHDRKQYLDSWEESHGEAKYEMVFSHYLTKEQAKLSGSSEGAECMRAALVGSKPKYSAKRNWHEAA